MSNKQLAMTLTALLLFHRLLQAYIVSATDKVVQMSKDSEAALHSTAILVQINHNFKRFHNNTDDNPPNVNDDDHHSSKDDEGAFSLDLVIYCVVMLILILSTCFKECQRASNEQHRSDDSDTHTSDGRIRGRRHLSSAERKAFIMKHLIVQKIPDPNAKPKAFENSDNANTDSRLGMIQKVIRRVSSSIMPGVQNTPQQSLTKHLLSEEIDESQAIAALSHIDDDDSFTSTNFYNCCTICMDEYAPGEEICFSKYNRICNHHYHLKCMMSWLMTKHNIDRDDACPICRANYLLTIDDYDEDEVEESTYSISHPFAGLEDRLDNYSITLHSI